MKKLTITTPGKEPREGRIFPQYTETGVRLYLTYDTLSPDDISMKHVTMVEMDRETFKTFIKHCQITLSQRE